MLDEITVGCSLGAEPMCEDVLQTRLKFGLFNGDRPGQRTNDDGSEEMREYKRAGFGLESQVRSLKRDQGCY